MLSVFNNACLTACAVAAWYNNNFLRGVAVADGAMVQSVLNPGIGNFFRDFKASSNSGKFSFQLLNVRTLYTKLSGNLFLNCTIFCSHFRNANKLRTK